MNCCDAWGNCDQSDTCPARTGVVLPHQAAHARRVAAAHGVAPIKSSRPKWMDGKATPRTCDELGICQGRGDCDCTHPVPPEAGNFQIVDLGPDDDGQPLSRAEGVALAWTLLAWLACVLALVALVAGATGYATELWADVLWAYLVGLP